MDNLAVKDPFEGLGDWNPQVPEQKPDRRGSGFEKFKAYTQKLAAAKESDTPFDGQKETYQEWLSESGEGKKTVEQFLHGSEGHDKAHIKPLIDAVSGILDKKSEKILAVVDQAPETEKYDVFQAELQKVGILLEDADKNNYEKLFDDTGKMLPAELKSFLEQRCTLSQITEDLLKLHEQMKQKEKEDELLKKQLEEEKKQKEEEIRRLEADTQFGGASENEPSALQTARQELAALNSTLENLGENIDMPGFLNLIFALDRGGYGYTSSAYRNGLEKRDVKKTDKTLTALKRLLMEPGKSPAFFQELLKEELTNSSEINKETIKNKLTLFTNLESYSPEDQAKRKQEFKKRIFRALKKQDVSNIFAGIESWEDISLSSEVIQLMMNTLEKMPEQKKS